MAMARTASCHAGAAPQPALGQGKHPAVPQYLPSCRTVAPAALGDSDATARGQPSPRCPQQHLPKTTEVAPTWLAGTRVCLPEKNSSEIKPQRKAPEWAIPNASDSFINDSPRIRYNRRVGLFTSLASRRRIPGKLAREQTKLCSISRHPPRQALARCSRVCFRLQEQQKTCDLQSCKQSHFALISSVTASGGAQGGRNRTPCTASA